MDQERAERLAHAIVRAHEAFPRIPVDLLIAIAEQETDFRPRKGKSHEYAEWQIRCRPPCSIKSIISNPNVNAMLAAALLDRRLTHHERKCGKIWWKRHLWWGHYNWGNRIHVGNEWAKYPYEVEKHLLRVRKLLEGQCKQPEEKP